MKVTHKGPWVIGSNVKWPDDDQINEQLLEVYILSHSYTFDLQISIIRSYNVDCLLDISAH
jgi:hypothetical protein